MHQNEISAALADLPLGGLRFFSSIGSTNDEALSWAANGAQDLSVVVADEQTAGRGRAGRKWHTPPGAALAFTVILRPTSVERVVPARVTGLAAVALSQCLGDLGLEASIKWPNDVLLRGRKTAGILAEMAWSGNQVEACVLGIGVNVSPAAVPPAEQLAFPASSVEAGLGRPVDRLVLLHDILKDLLAWRKRIGSPEFIQAWEDSLAFRGQQVLVGEEGKTPLEGTLLGLEPDGSLRLGVGDVATVLHFGEIRLRPRDDRIESAR